MTQALYLYAHMNNKTIKKKKINTIKKKSIRVRKNSAMYNYNFPSKESFKKLKSKVTLGNHFQPVVHYSGTTHFFIRTQSS
jgi:hypothetical protein